MSPNFHRSVIFVHYVGMNQVKILVFDNNYQRCHVRLCSLKASLVLLPNRINVIQTRANANYEFYHLDSLLFVFLVGSAISFVRV